MSTEYTESSVETTDKYKLHVKKWAPKKEDSKKPKAQLVLIHGYLEHCGRYAEFGEYLASNDIALVAFDVRGHGKSDGQRAYCWNFAQYHLDLEAVLTTIDADVPVFVLGHSAGGVILLDYLKKHGSGGDDTLSKWWKGAILSCPFLAPAEVVPAWKIWASRILAWVAPVLSVPADEVTSEVLTQDAQKRKEHDEDPLNLHSATIGWGYGVLKTQASLLKEWKPPSVGSLPLLLCFGAADKVADPNVTREFFGRLESTDKTIDERKDKFHEILNETDRKDLFKQIKDWMMDHCK